MRKISHYIITGFMERITQVRILITKLRKKEKYPSKLLKY